MREFALLSAISLEARGNAKPPPLVVTGAGARNTHCGFLHHALKSGCRKPGKASVLTILACAAELCHLVVEGLAALAAILRFRKGCAMTAEAAPELIDARELGKRLKLAPATLLAFSRAGKIPCVRLGARTIRFDYPAVVAALEAASQEKATT